jgi:hypothetical protein
VVGVGDPDVAYWWALGFHDFLDGVEVYSCCFCFIYQLVHHVKGGFYVGFCVVVGVFNDAQGGALGFHPVGV